MMTTKYSAQKQQPNSVRKFYFFAAACVHALIKCIRRLS